MNYFYLESRSKEKMQELISEGITSQLHHRSSRSKNFFSHGIIKLIAALLSILGIAELLVH